MMNMIWRRGGNIIKYLKLEKNSIIMKVKIMKSIGEDYAQKIYIKLLKFFCFNVYTLSILL